MQQVHFGGQDNSGVFCLTDSVLSGAFLLGAYIFVYIKKKETAIIVLQILDANVHSLVVRATRNPEFVHPLTLPFMPCRHTVLENRDINTNCKYFSMFSPCCECCILSFGDSSAAEFYAPTFRSTLFHLHRSCEQKSCSHDL